MWELLRGSWAQNNGFPTWRLAKRDTNRVAQYCREDSVFISKMEGNLEKDSISEWRKKKREKKNASKKKYYLENREMLAEKARQRMKRLREKQKLAKLRGRVGVATRCTSKEKNVSQAKAIQACAKRIEKKREEEREQLRKEQKRRQTSARANKYREKRKRLENQAGQEPEPEVECVTPSGPAFTSRTAKKRAKDKVTPTLPKLPRKKAEVVQTLADNPGTKIILEKRGFLQSSSERQDTQAMKSVVADLADGLARVHDCYVFMTFLKTTHVDHKMKFNYSISIPTKFLFMLRFSTATQISCKMESKVQRMSLASSKNTSSPCRMIILRIITLCTMCRVKS